MEGSIVVEKALINLSEENTPLLEIIKMPFILRLFNYISDIQSPKVSHLKHASKLLLLFGGKCLGELDLVSNDQVSFLASPLVHGHTLTR